jgi:nitrile hydratase beta subunit
MNGVHDLGGMDGMGPIVVEENEPVFHAEWERRVFGMFLPIFACGYFNIDELRHAIEKMGAPAYLNTSYYEHWLHAYETLLVEKGAITAQELAARRAEIAQGAA